MRFDDPGSSSISLSMAVLTFLMISSKSLKEHEGGLYMFVKIKPKTLTLIITTSHTVFEKHITGTAGRSFLTYTADPPWLLTDLSAR